MSVEGPAFHRRTQLAALPPPTKQSIAPSMGWPTTNFRVLWECYCSHMTYVGTLCRIHMWVGVPWNYLKEVNARLGVFGVSFVLS